MKKIVLILLAAVLMVGMHSCSQTTVYSYNGLYQIEIPDILELQDSELNELSMTQQLGMKTMVTIMASTEKIVFQQKGLNANDKEAYKQYCRLILNYYKESQDEPTLSKGDFLAVDNDLLLSIYENAKEGCRLSGCPFIKMITVQPLTINGFPVLYYSYKRQGWQGKQPPVIVNTYCIFNRFESVDITFSYREAEQEKWRDIHNYIIQTFTFSKMY